MSLILLQLILSLITPTIGLTWNENSCVDGTLIAGFEVDMSTNMINWQPVMYVTNNTISNYCVVPYIYPNEFFRVVVFNP